MSINHALPQTLDDRLPPAGIFDLDGTVFKSSILEKNIEVGIANGLFDSDKFHEIAAARSTWQIDNTEDNYLKYLDQLIGYYIDQIKGASESQIDEVAKITAEQQAERLFSFPVRLAGELAPRGYNLYMLSGSPSHCLSRFIEHLPFKITGYYGSTYEVLNGAYTGKASPLPEKSEVYYNLVQKGMLHSPGSVAIGDTMGDYGLLASAEWPIMFNPSQTLKEAGGKNGWPIVYEVKDNITVLVQNPQGFYQEISADTALGGMIIPG